MDFFEGLDPILKTFWYVAIPASLIFLVQTVMTFTGADATDGIEADFDGNFDSADAPFQLFSFRNLIHFLLGFSWTGISFYTTVDNKIVLFILSAIIGAGFVALFFLIIKQLRKLAQNNSFTIQNTLNKTADVYLSIPEQKSGKGKVMVSVNGAFHELEAMTEGEKIPTGKTVKIVRIESNSILIVESL